MSFIEDAYKIGIYITNLFFFLIGILLFYTSCVFSHNSLIELNYIEKNFVYLSFFVSIMLILSSLFGSYAIYHDDSSYTKYFIVSILICIILQAVVFFIFPKTEFNKIDRNLIRDFIVNYDKIDHEYKDIIDDIQSTNKCCGIFSYSDYTKQIQNLPLSCCDHYSSSLCLSTTVYTTGCQSFIHESFLSSKETLYIVLSLVFCVQGFLIIFSSLFMNKIKQYINAAPNEA